MKRFARAVPGHETTVPSPADGFEAMGLIDAAMQSIEGNESVSRKDIPAV